MELKRHKTLTHLFLGSYTIGFVVGGFTFFISLRNSHFQIKFSIESILCAFILLPIIYWIYRYSGMVFNNQPFTVKFLYLVLFILGMFLGILFFELIGVF
ncbi:MAG: hypothetical protein M3043_07235 [Lysinibacillus fusiformis]|uniref:hypothetical protein n=1 Tax=Lysinibacillus TaxID=400634 RepID=UPI00050897DC|nr:MULTISPECIES: hypothetical protein [Lysinibacillus]KGA80559.1 hypothetical protein KQ41_16995 [Lysinibacillus fusiformis]MCE4045677.1 hypothetical protein [Lysinibacillus fusiformis]MCK1989908.1 hypothetical protein [Lysinibacillus fusiformis]MCT6816186.1 hypothetical protein [Lysinibacillus fusiformis]MCT6929187.1 hypothetical protein [Lysinibacillus fusiformis]